MDDAEIVALLSGIEPSVGEIPHPPFMAAIAAGPVVEAGADVDAVDAWVKARGGWTHRTPAHLAGPGDDRPALFFIVPSAQLASGGGAGRGRPHTFSVGAGRPPTFGAGRAAPVPGHAGPSASPSAGLGSADVMAFVATTDLAVARAFYERGLGLAFTGQSPIACTFDCGGRMLRVVLVEEPVIAPYTVLGWVVADVRATVSELATRGIDFERFDGLEQDDVGVWHTPGGAAVAWFKDPDGTVLSLTQF